jgi:4-hydroxy-4-methyl-2-oxoglutarate aldolase
MDVTVPESGIAELTAETARRLRAAGTATVYEAGGQIGALPSSIKPIAPGMALIGRAFPVSVGPGDNLHLHRALAAAHAGDVLVVDTGGAHEHGYFGEVMARAALARGIAGLVIDGGVRDADRLAALGFPVFAARVCIRGTTKRPEGTGTLGRPIVIGDARVQAGDVVLADTDGVVVVPADRVDDTAELAEQRERREQEIFSDLADGRTTLEIYGLP